ncbi:MAG: diaminopimelate epimerase [Gaiellales bacterium]
MRFEKWHALGNTYLVIERPVTGALDPGRVRRLCDPELGIGSHGVLEIVSRGVQTAEIVIWNPDGSVAEMSGNGTRIAALWLSGETGAAEVRITTAGREIHGRVVGQMQAELDMGRVEVGSLDRLDVDGEAVSFVPVSVGNPHAVVHLPGARRDDLLRLGPAIERHSRFPDRTNVQLVDPVGPTELQVLVWERGAGETPASGSSATAAAAAAVAEGWCVGPVDVHMPGGDLFVTLAGDRATLLGPAERICVGETPL